MRKHLKLIIGGVIVLLALLGLGYAFFMGGTTYYYNVGEFLDKSQALSGQVVRISGQVAPDAIQNGNTWHFSLTDMTGREASLKVVYSGPVPNTFKTGQQVVVEGKLEPGSGVFAASSIITKCSSKYVPVSQ